MAYYLSILLDFCYLAHVASEYFQVSPSDGRAECIKFRDVSAVSRDRQSSISLNWNFMRVNGRVTAEFRSAVRLRLPSFSPLLHYRTSH